MTTSSRRLLLLASLGLLPASLATAQTTGTLIGVVTDAQTGAPIAGALVVATGPFLQGPQTGLTDGTGAFRITLLPPGEYRVAVEREGYLPAERSDLTLRLDMTLRANLVLVPEAVRMEEQVVRSSQARPVVDVGSAESGTIIAREFLDDIPVGRGFQDVAVVAPTARLDRFGVAFAGATSPENGYLLDGMTVNDPVNSSLGLEIRSNFVQEIEVKTGNFMPEYGFSTGGILNVVTKSGSNEFHGSVFGYWTPGFIRPEPKATGRDAEALSLQTVQNGSYEADLGFEVGGPILKDRLWFYVGFSPGISQTRVERVVTAIQEDPANPGFPLRDAGGFAIGVEQPDYTRAFDTRTIGYQLTSKLTYLFNENNTLAVSFTTTPSTSDWLAGANADPASAQNKDWSSSTQAVARYASKLLEKRLIVELLGGWHRQQYQPRPRVVDGLDQANTPSIWWNWTEPLATFQGVPAACQATASGFEPCPVTGYVTGGWGAGDSTTDRFTGKGSVTWLASLLGSHLIKAGAELDRTRSQKVYLYSGGQSLEARAARAPNTNYRSAATNPDELANPYVSAASYLPGQGFPGTAGIWYRSYQLGYTTGPNAAHTLGTGANIVPSWDVTSVASTLGLYLQDSWSPLDGLTLNAGLRWEAQDMGLEGQPANLSINDNFGPRVQAIYDWTRQGRSKASASWGRFYEAVPLIMSNLSFANVNMIESTRAYCYDPRTDPTHAQIHTGPVACAVRPGYYDRSGNATPGSSYTYAGASGTTGSTTPVAPDIKGQYVDMFSGTVEYELLPDLSVGLEYQGRRLGRVIEDMSVDDGYNYFIANPGTGAPFYNPNTGTIVDPKVATGAVDPVTGRTYDAPFPRPRRDYDGLTFSVRKNFSSHWQLQGSYTWSSLRGNFGGLVGGVNEGQLMPNITTSFDLASLLANADGPLPGDSTHQLKAYGSYTFDLGPRFSVTAGGGVRAWSGTPVNYMGAHPVYGAGQAFILPRGSAGRTPFLAQADLGARLQYVVVPPYAVRFSVDAFNLLNAQQATAYAQNWTFDNVLPAIGAQCHSRNGAGGSNPIGKALADCPALSYLTTIDGLPASINQNFGRPTAYQDPLAIRLGLELTF